jgi:transcriptional regulator with XRE-family HTH domain
MTSWEEMSKLIDQFGDERNVAGRIRQLRESKTDEKGRAWSQEDLARRMTDAGYPMTHTSIWKIENPDKKSGGRSIPIGEAVGFARVLGVTLAELLLPDTAVRELEGWKRLAAATDALNEIRTAWPTYVQEIEAVRFAVAATPDLAARVAQHLQAAEADRRRQIHATWVNDAETDDERRTRQKHDPARLPRGVEDGYPPTPAIVAARTALSSAPLPEFILEEIGGSGS